MKGGKQTTHLAFMRQRPDTKLTPFLRTAAAKNSSLQGGGPSRRCSAIIYSGGELGLPPVPPRPHTDGHGCVLGVVIQVSTGEQNSWFRFENAVCRHVFPHYGAPHSEDCVLGRTWLVKPLISSSVVDCFFIRASCCGL